MWSPTSASRSGKQVVDARYEHPRSPRVPGAAVPIPALFGTKRPGYHEHPRQSPRPPTTRLTGPTTRQEEAISRQRCRLASQQKLSGSQALWKMIIFVFGCFLIRFLVKVGPKTPLNGSSSINGAERTRDERPEANSVPFRDNRLYCPQKLKCKTAP
jgi:hypothetical protein